MTEAELINVKRLQDGWDALMDEKLTTSEEVLGSLAQKALWQAIVLSGLDVPQKRPESTWDDSDCALFAENFSEIIKQLIVDFYSSSKRFSMDEQSRAILHTPTINIKASALQSALDRVAECKAGAESFYNFLDPDLMRDNAVASALALGKNEYDDFLREAKAQIKENEAALKGTRELLFKVAIEE